MPARLPAVLATVLVAGGLAATAVVAAGPAAASNPLTVTVKPNGAIAVQARGNGHGHGMSQYGARGAAMQGLSYKQIVGFYYRNSTIARTRDAYIRVLLSGYGSYTTVAASSTLQLAGPALVAAGKVVALSDGPARYRLVPGSGTTLTLQQLARTAHATWTTMRTGLPDQTAFRSSTGSPVQIFSPNGTSGVYYGALRAVRSGSGVVSVNRVSIDHYTAGVVPYEMPSSWPQAAVRAQAVAARTYGVYGVEHPQSRYWDICDTTSCQVYGGYEQRNAANQVTASDFAPAATATSDQVLTYQGRPIFAQFSASNGGWEDSGGQPYLPSQRDPYDDRASGDPYLTIHENVSARSIASWFGLAKLTGITVTGRDGNGQWGGRVDTVTLTGTNSSGAVQHVRTEGYELQYAFGLGTTWFTVSAAS